MIKTKQILLLALTTFFLLCFPNLTLAKSGACSSHGGVNCAVGPDYDGSVICQDGWRESSVAFTDNKECGISLCDAMANLSATNQVIKYEKDLSTTGNVSTPESCKQFVMSIEQAAKYTHMNDPCIPGETKSCSASIGDRYTQTLDIYKENKQLLQSCVFNFYHAEALLSCYKTISSVSQPTGPNTQTESLQQDNKRQVRAKQNVNLRTTPKTNGKIIGMANKKSIYEIIEEQNGWYKIKIKNGKIGWSISKYFVNLN